MFSYFHLTRIFFFRTSTYSLSDLCMSSADSDFYYWPPGNIHKVTDFSHKEKTKKKRGNFEEKEEEEGEVAALSKSKMQRDN